MHMETGGRSEVRGLVGWGVGTGTGTSSWRQEGREEIQDVEPSEGEPRGGIKPGV